MVITFPSSRIRNLFISDDKLFNKFGSQRAELIRRRLGEILAMPNLADLQESRLGDCHQLTGDRKGEWAVKLDHANRLIFRPLDPPKSLTGGIDVAKTTQIEILEVIDYHGKKKRK